MARLEVLSVKRGLSKEVDGVFVIVRLVGRLILYRSRRLGGSLVAS